MSKTIAVLGHSGIIHDVFKKTTAEIFAESGQNTGNFAFWFGVSRHLKCEKTYIGWHYSPKLINERHSGLLMVAANWIGPHSNLVHLAKMIEGVEVPIVIVGLGAQAGLSAAPNAVELQQGTKDFLELVKQKGAFVGARGDFSAELLTNYGIKNVQVMGCPSNFINVDQQLGQKISAKFKNIELRRIALNFDLGGAIAPSVKNYASWLTKFGGAFVCQNPLEPLHLSRNECAQLEVAYLDHVRQMVMPQLDLDSFLRYVSTYFQVFYDAESWMGYLRTCDLSLGSRLHGNVLAFQAETPAVIIPHDSRTKELSETIKLPTVSIKDASNIFKPDDFLKSVQFDGVAYDENRKKLAQTYVGLLKNLTTELSEGLLNFIHTDPAETRINSISQ